MLEYFDIQSDNRIKIMFVLHDFLLSFPGVTCKMKYKIPFYNRKKDFCYLNAIKPDNVELSFTHGSKLSNDQGMLDPKGRKLVADITYSSIEEIHFETLREFIAEAFIIDDYTASDFSKKKQPIQKAKKLEISKV